MKSIFAIAFATIYGLAIRFLFAFLNNFMEIMSITFLLLVPIGIGFLTVALTPKKKISSGGSAFFRPWLTSLVILAITILLKIEGVICWIMIYPLFAILAGCGGLIAYHTLKRHSKKGSDYLDDNDWEKPNTLNVSLLIFMPLIIGLIEGDRTTFSKEFNITREVVISAPPTTIWRALTYPNERVPIEKTSSLANFLGFPKHLRTTLDTLAIGGKRMVFYENGLYFEETILKYEPEHLLVLAIKTDPNKIPPTVLDEHIVIGGKHIDIQEDVYKLEQLIDGSSRLTLSSRFYINTPFNWYAGIWATYLMSDILQGELDLIKKRTSVRF